MKELSLNILDIVENSAKAGASLIEVSLIEADHILTMKVIDNGCGMTPDMLNASPTRFAPRAQRVRSGLGYRSSNSQPNRPAGL